MKAFLMGSRPAQGRPPSGGVHHGPLCGAAAGPGVLLGVGAIPAASPLTRCGGLLRRRPMNRLPGFAAQDHGVGWQGSGPGGSPFLHAALTPRRPTARHSPRFWRRRVRCRGALRRGGSTRCSWRRSGRMSGIIVQCGQYCRPAHLPPRLQGTMPGFRPGVNTDSTEVNGGPSLHVGAKDYSRPRSAQLRLVLLETGLPRFVDCPLMGSWTKSPQKVRL
jgi:hypothetical protein